MSTYQNPTEQQTGIDQKNVVYEVPPHHQDGPMIADEKYNKNNYLILCILGILTGFNGIHKIYADDYKVGAVQFFLGMAMWGVFGWVLGYLVPWFLIAVIWNLVDLAKYESYINTKNQQAEV
mmetsp:Transcript_710/g.1108  ORF Transcript_710/g.1108 Transcript_710/m.1108 type:complete len:122 (+) Transcript_710:45-410(+)